MSVDSSELLCQCSFSIPCYLASPQEKEAATKERELEAAENELKKKRAEAAEKEQALQAATEEIRGAHDACDGLRPLLFLLPCCGPSGIMHAQRCFANS